MSDSISRIPFKVWLESNGEAIGEFIRFLSPRTVDALLRLLPIQERVYISHCQIYSPVKMKLGNEKPVLDVHEGDVAYWPFGRALCFFTGDMKPYRPVNLVGKIQSGIKVIKNIKSGTRIKVERN